MFDFGAYSGVILVGWVAAIVGTLITFWIRWEDRHKHPPVPPSPRR